jgi:hypothetical protein
VVIIYTMSGLVRDGRSNGGGRRQVLGGSEWLGGSGGGGIKGRFDSKLADVGNPLVARIGRHIRWPRVGPEPLTGGSAQLLSTLTGVFRDFPQL